VPKPGLGKRDSHDSFEDDTFDFDDDELAQLDMPAPVPRSTRDADLMPPPPLSAAPRAGPRELSTNRSAAQQQQRAPPPRKASLSLIDASSSISRLKPTTSAVIELEESSSPGVIAPGRRANQPRIIQSSEGSELAAPRPLGGVRLVRAGERTAEEDEAASRRHKRERRGPQPSKKRMKVDMHKHDLFDVEAVDDDAEGDQSSDPEEEVRYQRPSAACASPSLITGAERK
jgi:hypothetical protein